MADTATRASLDYLTVLERRLRITWTARGDPVFVPDRVPPVLVSALRTELHDLLTGSISEASIDATRKFGENRVQTVGFGVARDFDRFVKLGFLYGERLVLWDLIGSRLLQKKGIAGDELLAVGIAACNLLLLRAVVEDGGAVILPPPPMWSEFARLVADDLKGRTRTTSAAYGLCMALSTVEDGLRLHPYTQPNRRDRLVPHKALTQPAEELYSRGNQDLHASLGEMLADQRLVFLQDVSAKEFYRVTRRFPDLQRDIAFAFSHSRSGLSKEQLSAEDSKKISEIIAGLRRRNGAQGKHVVDGLEASAGLTTATLTALAAGRFEVAGWLFAATVADLSVKLFASLRKWYATPKTPVIVQAFRRIKSLSEEELEGEYYASLDLVRSRKRAEKNWEKFTEPDWVEQRHLYMEKLPKREARNLLESLDQAELYHNVNVRRFQEAYICDYLADVWTISKTAFWEHIKMMCRHGDGLVLSDSDAYLEPLLAEGLPSEVWWGILWTITKVKPDRGGYMEEVLARIVHAQTSSEADGERRRSEMKEWYRALDDQEVQIVALHPPPGVRGNDSGLARGLAG